MSELEEYCESLKAAQVESLVAHGSATVAMLTLLLEKGVFTQGEYESKLATVTAAMDQQFAKAKDEVEATFEKLMRKA
jgi:hypothetical protein